MIARALLRRLFASLETPKPEALTRAEATGRVVFVLRAVSAVDAIAVAHVRQSWGDPPLGYVHDLPEASGRLVAAVSGARLVPSLSRALDERKSAVIFMRRPPSLFEPTVRAEGDDPLATIFDFCRTTGEEVTLVPLALLWSTRPEKLVRSPLDVLFGSTDMPGDARSLLQLVTSLGHGVLRVAEPLRVSSFLASQAGAPDAPLVRRASYALLRRIERERRASVGPARKPTERLVAEVLRSPKLANLATDLAKGDLASRRALLERAHGMLDEAVAKPNADMVDALEPLMDALVRRVFSAVEIDVGELDAVRDRAKRGSVVLLPSHKSHVDYLILSYVLRKNLLELPVVAAGDNLGFFPVGPLLRRGGAFFIRRDFRGDRLYAATIDAYVRRLIKDGWALEFFLEGGRSRTGKLLPAKLGLLNIVVDAALHESTQPVSFVPVHIGYDRTMEDFELSLEKAGARKERESARSLLAIADALSYPYGRVTVSFGEPIDLDEHVRALGLSRADDLTPARRRSVTTSLAARVEAGIQRSARVTAGALLDMPLRGINLAGMTTRVSRLFAVLAREGARPLAELVGPSGWVREEAVAEALDVYTKARLIREHIPDAAIRRTGDSTGLFRDTIWTVPEESRARLELTKNAILHFVWDRAMLACSFHALRDRRVARERLLLNAEELCALLGADLPMHTTEPPATRLARTLDDMLEFGELAAEGETIQVGPGNVEAEGSAWLAMHRGRVTATLESLRIAVYAAHALPAADVVEERTLTSRALELGREMFLRAEIDKREAVSAPNLQSAWALFAKRGLLKRAKDGFVLPDEAAREGLRAVDERLASLRGEERSPRGSTG
jgi:glycerol-3-phosphate O-acyltransferase